MIFSRNVTNHEHTAENTAVGGINLPLPLPAFFYCSGIWTVFSWVYWYNNVSTAFGVPLQPFVSIAGVMFLVQLIIGAVCLRYAGTIALERFDLPITVMMCVCTGSMAAQSFLGITSTVWSFGNLIFAGICAGIMYLRWGELFARMDIRATTACLLTAYLISALFKIILDILPPLAEAVIVFMLPIVSFISLVHVPMLDLEVCCAPLKTSAVIYKKGNYSVLFKATVCIMVLCAVRQVLTLIVPTISNELSEALIGHLIEGTLAIIIFAWVFVFHLALDFSKLWRIVFLILTTVILVASLAPLSPWVSPLLVSATSLIWMYAWLFTCDVAHHCDQHPYVVFGFMFGPMYTGGSYLGLIALQVSGQTALEPSYGIVLIWILGAVLALIESSSPDIRRIFADLHPRITPEEFVSVDTRCEKLGQEAGLSARELEVFKLLAKGRSRAFIAEELFLSENTVRGHTSRIYAKLNVHNKDELQRLVG